ncbi:MAG: YHS domain-containing protein [Limnochordaceae bacterium]|uniref:YHS domain-containing protein n=1 Tax=Carboxydichorda subterranea TaxID=3109565 RepID=A0ABZ1BZ47_9FIRM|nr:YHS domain-containing protein [Limnochorda sp. L945t]MBE3598970.1 YHS domain-containing protein [Limnochordaceae bacterium]WRP17776.1 YHS domain-containing protein [Limnochorda sp. L945t]
MAVDPVCHAEVDESRSPLRAVYHGRTYYFCSAACKAAFDRNAARYVEEGAPEQGGVNGSRAGLLPRH